MTDAPMVSLVIPTRNRGRLLAEVLEPLWTQTARSALAEIIVVDNCSTDDTADRVGELATRSPCPLRYHRMPEDRGPAVSRNAGARLASSPVIGYVDSDVALAPDWLERALDALQRDASIGIVGGKLVYASRPERLNSFGGAMGPIGLAWDAHEGAEAASRQSACECLWTATAAVLIRRELFEKLGGFDETFYLFFEDSDFGWRANLAGYRCVCIPDAVAYHRISEAPSDLSDFLTFHACKNRLRSLIRNSGASRLARCLPLYLGYATLDALLRRPRLPKFKALLWNLTNLGDTLRRRGETQRERRLRDDQIAHLFSPRLFAPERRGRRRRRLTGAGA